MNFEQATAVLKRGGTIRRAAWVGDSKEPAFWKLDGTRLKAARSNGVVVADYAMVSVKQLLLEDWEETTKDHGSVELQDPVKIKRRGKKR